MPADHRLDHVERFTAAGAEKPKISFARSTFTFRHRGSPAELLAIFRTYYGPTMNAYEAAEKDGRAAQLHEELTTLFNAQNTSTQPGVTAIPATYLRVTVEV